MSMIALRRSTILAEARGGRLSHLPHLSDLANRRLDRLDGGGSIEPREVMAIIKVGAVAPDVEKDLADAKTVDEADAVYDKYLAAGQVPDYIKTSYWVGRRLTGGGHTLDLLVAPDYGAVVGSDGHPFRIGKESQFFAQKYANAFDAILPSQKLLRDLEGSADVKLGFIPVQRGGGADDSIEGVITANDKAAAALAGAGATDDDLQLKIGYRKAYVTRPGLNGDYLAIYGGRWSPAGGLVQPTSGHAHTTGRIPGTPNYSDYSHGIVLVSRKAKLDGADVDLRTDVFGSSDPSVYGLVSDEGKFDPVFPNAGDASIASFSVGEGSTGGGDGGVDTSVIATTTPKGGGGAGGGGEGLTVEGEGGGGAAPTAGIGEKFASLSTGMKVGVVALVALIGGGLAWVVVH